MTATTSASVNGEGKGEGEGGGGGTKVRMQRTCIIQAHADVVAAAGAEQQIRRGKTVAIS